MHEVLVNRLGGLSLPRKSVVRLTDRPDMTLDVYRGRKTTMQQQQPISDWSLIWLELVQNHFRQVLGMIQVNANSIQTGPWFDRGRCNQVMTAPWSDWSWCKFISDWSLV